MKDYWAMVCFLKSSPRCLPLSAFSTIVWLIHPAFRTNGTRTFFMKVCGTQMSQDNWAFQIPGHTSYYANVFLTIGEICRHISGKSHRAKSILSAASTLISLILFARFPVPEPPESAEMWDALTSFVCFVELNFILLRSVVPGV